MLLLCLSCCDVVLCWGLRCSVRVYVVVFGGGWCRVMVDFVVVVIVGCGWCCVTVDFVVVVVVGSGWCC